MTISSTTVKNSYNGDGSTTTFSYTFKIFADSDLQVIIRNNTTATETVKTITTHYTVTGAGSASGGSVIFTAGNIPASGETVVLRRAVPQTQAIDYIANDPFPAESHEEGLDRAMMTLQQLQEEVTRSIKLSRTNTMTSTEFTIGASARAGKFLSFDSNGELVVSQEVGTYQGTWSAGTTYAARDIVKDSSNNNIYLCNTGHTSSGTTPLSSNADIAKWDLLVDAASATASASAAATSATNAANSATAAASSASSASTSASSAASSLSSVETIYDNFDDRFLGTKASDPTLDNDGNALAEGAIYYNSTTNEVKFYNGSSWDAPATQAASSATSASSSASSASTSASNAATSATNAANSATTAGTQATNASNYATAAATSASNAATSESNASTSASNAASSASTATTQATNASNSATSAASSAASAAAALDSFDDTYLGAKASDPSVDNDGDPLNAGDTYYDTTNSVMKVYNGSSWDAIQTGITDVAPTRHSIRPSLNLDFANSKVLDPRITFTRASNATYYDGYTSVKAEENLLSYSQQFNNAYWINTRSTIVDNAVTAPDGTTTASTYTETTDSSTKQLYRALNGFVSGEYYTHSIYVKANGRTKIKLQPLGTALVTVVDYDLTAVTSTVSSGTALSHNITDVGNGWYRCSVTFTANGTGAGYFQFNLCDASGNISYTGDGTSGVYLWGAQAEQRDSLTAYTATTTSPITKYQPALQTAGNNVARFDHNPTTGESLGLLIEESRTNLQVYSEEFDNGAWSKGASSVTANTIIAPDGTLTADKLVEDTATGEHTISDVFSFTSGTTYTGTIYAKKAERTLIRFGGANTATWGASIIADLSNGTIANTFAGSGTITDAGNDWYRISVTGQALATAGTGFNVRLVSSGTTISYTGDGYSGAYIWGAQLEQGSFPTSYIKTEGSQVTRSADDAVMNNIDTSEWFKQGEGTIYGEVKSSVSVVTDSANNGILSFSKDSSIFSNVMYWKYHTDQHHRTYVNGVQQHVGNAGNFVTDSYNKFAGAFKRNDFGISLNAGTVDTYNNSAVPEVNTLHIGSVSNYKKLIHIKKLSYYPLRLTDNEITDLTEE